MHLRYLEQLVSDLSTLPTEYEEKSRDRPRIVAIFDALERKAVVPVGFGELGLTHGRAMSGDQLLETMIEQNLFFDLRLSEACSLDKVLDLCWLMQDMVTLGCDYPSALTDLAMNTRNRRPIPQRPNSCPSSPT